MSPLPPGVYPPGVYPPGTKATGETAPPVRAPLAGSAQPFGSVHPSVAAGGAVDPNTGAPRTLLSPRQVKAPRQGFPVSDRPEEGATAGNTAEFNQHSNGVFAGRDTRDTLLDALPMGGALLGSVGGMAVGGPPGAMAGGGMLAATGQGVADIARGAMHTPEAPTSSGDFGKRMGVTGAVTAATEGVGRFLVEPAREALATGAWRGAVGKIPAGVQRRFGTMVPPNESPTEFFTQTMRDRGIPLGNPSRPILRADVQAAAAHGDDLINTTEQQVVPGSRMKTDYHTTFGPGVESQPVKPMSVNFPEVVGDRVQVTGNTEFVPSASQPVKPIGFDSPTLQHSTANPPPPIGDIAAGEQAHTAASETVAGFAQRHGAPLEDVQSAIMAEVPDIKILARLQQLYGINPQELALLRKSFVSAPEAVVRGSAEAAMLPKSAAAGKTAAAQAREASTRGSSLLSSPLEPPVETTRVGSRPDVTMVPDGPEQSLLSPRMTGASAEVVPEYGMRRTSWMEPNGPPETTFPVATGTSTGPHPTLKPKVNPTASEIVKRAQKNPMVGELRFGNDPAGDLHQVNQVLDEWASQQGDRIGLDELNHMKKQAAAEVRNIWSTVREEGTGRATASATNRTVAIKSRADAIRQYLEENVPGLKEANATTQTAMARRLLGNSIANRTAPAKDFTFLGTDIPGLKQLVWQIGGSPAALSRYGMLLESGAAKVVAPQLPKAAASTLLNPNVRRKFGHETVPDSLRGK